jgi:hypothetical protein
MRCSTRFSLGFVLFAVLVGVFNLPAMASDCDDPLPVEEVFARHPMVFVGRVVAVPPKSREEMRLEVSGLAHDPVEMVVEESFRGVVIGERVVVICHYWRHNRWRFSVGERFLVYGEPGEEGGRTGIYVGPCDHFGRLGVSGQVFQPEEDLAYLRKANEEPAGVTFSGRVIDRTRWHPAADGPVGLPKVTVELVGENGRTYDAVSAEDGEYLMTGVKPGTYKYRLKTPPGMVFGDDEREAVFTVYDRGGVVRDPAVLSTSRVEGAVVDATGKPLSLGIKYWGPGVTANLIACDESGQPLTRPEQVSPRRWVKRLLNLNGDETETPRFSHPLTGNGVFEFKNVRAGDYLLAIGDNPFGAGSIPLTKAYYPGVTDPAKAKIIRVKPGESVGNLVFQIVDTLVRREVTGSVVGPDGRPVAEAEVTLNQEKEIGWSLVQGGRTDANGHFRFIGFEGQTYIISVSHQNSETGKYFGAGSGLITCNGNVGPLILKLVPLDDPQP